MIQSEQGKKILGLIYNYGGTDGAHHKAWIIDQIVRILTEDDYDRWVNMWQSETGDPDDNQVFYEWDKGIAP